MALGLVICFLPAPKLSAQTWTGATNFDWNVSTNWNPNTVPNAQSDVIIPNTFKSPQINTGVNAFAKSIKVLAGGGLTITGNLTVIGSPTDGINNQGSILNQGQTKIGNTVANMNNGIFNSSTGVFSNFGTVNIGKMQHDGILNQGAMHNYGILNIGYDAMIGANGLENNGTFTNHVNGAILINYANKGILNAAGTFTNYAAITIGAYGQNANHITVYGIDNNASFLNDTDGFISIDRTGDYCLYNESNTFYNLGTVELAQLFPAVQGAFANLAGAYITTDHCAIWEANGYLSNAGEVVNIGFFKLNNVGATHPNMNTGLVWNAGMLENVTGDAIPGNFANTGMVVKPSDAECTLSNALQIASDNNMIANPIWYFDENLSNPAGNYNHTTNTFSQNNLVQGVNKVFFSIEEDGYGCTYTVSKTITLLPDHTPPTVVCKPAMVELNAAGSAILTPAQVLQSAVDNCSAVTPLSVTPNTFSCAQIGQSVSVLLTVSDLVGNTANCSTFIKVLDTAPPTMTCKNIAVNLDANGNASITPNQVDNGSKDNCSISSMSLSQSNFSCAQTGPNSIVLSGVDPSGNKGTCTATVTVRDVMPPKALCKNASVQLDASGSASIAASALDNGSSDVCGIQIMSVIPATLNCGNVGNSTVTLQVTDRSNNTATCTAIVTVRDLTPPVAVCKNINVFLDDAGHAVITGSNVDGGSTDACGIASRSLNLNQFDCGQVGATPVPVLLTVKDQSNNQASCTAMVSVKDNLAPTAVCENTTINLNAQGTATVYGANLAGNSFDNCAVWSFTPVAKNYTTANIGTNNLSITVKDFSGNGATCVSQIVIKPFQGIQAPANRSLETDAIADWHLFPNPASDIVNIQFQLHVNQVYQVRVFDLSGKLILEKTENGSAGDNQCNLDIQTLVSGAYIVQLQSKDIFKTMKLAVQRD
ncbi:MAG: T9SS type A sorting domain-containing protein [Bacteroidota bacterium]